jgi:hypothetical protein
MRRFQNHVNDRAVDLLVDYMEETGAKKLVKRSLKRDISPALHSPDPRVANFALNYLNAFGYFNKELAEWKDIKIEDVILAIKQFQAIFGLPKTGNLCVRSVRAMEMPRCGCPDKPKNSPEYLRMQQAITSNLPRWQKEGLTYIIKDYLPSFGKPDFESVIDQCFQQWASLGNLTISRTTAGNADIVISNGRGPQSNFDGPGGILAWAYLPDGSDQQLLMEFDLDESWTLTPNGSGILVGNVACHEFGHLVGLSHSTVQTALMAPYYNPTIGVPQAQDDIPRFQARYGAKPASTPTVLAAPAQGSYAVDIATTGNATITVNGKRIS